MRNYFNYFTEIEECFVKRRGKNLLVSTMDWCLIELWKNSNIPLHVVLRGIDRSFESAEKKHKKPPHTLFYCHPAVIDALEEYERVSVGAPGDQQSSRIGPAQVAISRQMVSDYLGGLEDLLRACETEGFDQIAGRLSSLRREVLQGECVNYETVDADLARIGEIVADTLRKTIAEEKFEDLKNQVRQQMKMYKRRLSHEMYRRLKKSCMDRKIRELHKFPEFTLFQLDG